MERVSEKPLIVLELGAQKGRWVMEQAFHGDFQVSVTWVFWPFPQFPRLNCAHSGVASKISSPCTS